MANRWTKEQQQAIEARGCTLLVSAAAGSGKTAVLVERILRMITDPAHPVDIDRILVVTFTRAAAGEMRERIRAALEKALEEDPENRNLQRQTVLVHHAKIMTIHSFCLDVIRSNFHRIGLDPAFRVADEGELTLLRARTMEELLEDSYAAADPDFLSFAEQMAWGRTDSGLDGVIDRFYGYSTGFPWPAGWRESCMDAWKAETEEELRETAWMKFLCAETVRTLEDLLGRARDAAALCLEPDGPWIYEDTVRFYEDLLELGCSLRGYDALAAYFADLPAFPAVKALRGKGTADISREKAGVVKDRLKEIRETLRSLADGSFALPGHDLLDLLAAGRKTARVLVDLTNEFEDRYTEAKRERGIVDFSDLEHLALQILMEEENGQMRPSDAARDYAGSFREIMIDEYQDSSMTQEVLLHSISGEARGGVPDRFMVGDVKQSIYRFRLARPELFTEKYDSWAKMPEDAASVPVEDRYFRIDLHKNFRSRPQVLHCVNEIFFRIMKREIGGVEYDEDAALRPGADYPAPAPADGRGGADPYLPELILLDESAPFLSGPIDASGLPDKGDGAGSAAGPDSPAGARNAAGSAAGADSFAGTGNAAGSAAGAGSFAGTGNAAGRSAGPDRIAGTGDTAGPADSADDSDGEEDLTAAKLEALAAAAKIRELLASFRVKDGEGGGTRPAVCSDIAILLRATSRWGDIFAEVLTEEGIPAYTETGSGYFTAPEIRLMLSFLSVLDNPMQDMPLAAVLHSPLGGLSDRELAMIRAGFREGNLYDACMAFLTFASSGEASAREREAGEKLRAFFDLATRYRDAAACLPLHELIWRIMDETGYGAWVRALPAGEMRYANLEMLAEKAQTFEQGSYRGLFHFIQYIEKLRSYDMDFAQAERTGGAVEAVRIMTVHKSKGLEFPIVITAGLGKRYNRTDAMEKIAVHPELGVGFDLVDPVLRTRCPSPVRGAILDALKQEDLGEELRILYVALTRAKEKLIMIGTVKDRAKAEEKWAGPDALSPLRSRCLLDLVVPALADSIAAEAAGGKAGKGTPSGSGSDLWSSNGVCSMGWGFVRTGAGAPELPGSAGLTGGDLTADGTGPEGSPDSRMLPGEDAGPAGNPGSRMLPADGAGPEGSPDSRMLPAEDAADRDAGPDAEPARREGTEAAADRERAAAVKAAVDRAFTVRQERPDVAGIRPKVSVSELKHIWMDLVDAEEREEVPREESISSETEDRDGNTGRDLSPVGASREDRARAAMPAGPAGEASSDRESAGPATPAGRRSALSAADRGTLYHRVMELIDLAGAPADAAACAQYAQMQLESMAKCGKIRKDAASYVRAEDIGRFLASPVGRRMGEAQKAGRLHRETPFVLGVDASEVDRAWSAEETVLVQGIIDAWMEEDDGLVLVDYKTDALPKDGLPGLCLRYKVQMDYYKKALEQLTGRRVKEMGLYSFRAGAFAPMDLSGPGAV